MIPWRKRDSVARAAHDDDDEAAIRAQLSDPNDAEYALVTDYLAGELSLEMRERVEELLQTDAKFRAFAEPLIMIWNVAGSSDREEDLADRIEAQRQWDKLERVMELEKLGIHTPTLAERRTKRRKRQRVVLSTIAGLVSGALLAWLQHKLIPIPSLYLHADAPYHEEVSRRLPDETEMTLLPGSYVWYSRSFADSGKHTLNLDGDASFAMARGPRSPLEVDGAGIEVKAYEGRFTVEAYDAIPIAHVIVYEGRVEVRPRTVYYGRGETLTLQTGEGARVGPGMYIEREQVPIAGRRTSVQSGLARVDQSVAQRSVSAHKLPHFAASGPPFADALEQQIAEAKHYHIACWGYDRSPSGMRFSCVRTPSRR